MLGGVPPVVLGLHLLSIAIFWNKLPNVIPVHFDFFGKPDSFGGKKFLLLLFGLNLLLYVGLTWFQANKSGNTSDRDRHSADTSLLVCILRLEVVCLFAIISAGTIAIALHRLAGLGKWFTLAVIIMFVLTLAIHFSLLSRRPVG
jgi:cytochrome bd-type quinol oxidase subunit 2